MSWSGERQALANSADGFNKLVMQEKLGGDGKDAVRLLSRLIVRGLKDKVTNVMLSSLPVSWTDSLYGQMTG